MKITKPFKYPTSVRLTKEQKERILMLSPNISYYIQRAVDKQLERDEWRLKND